MDSYPELGVIDRSQAFGMKAMQNPIHYEIIIEGQLTDQWTDWFEGLSITHGEDGCTTLTGPISDQAALIGMLYKIQSLNLILVAVNKIEAFFDK